MFTADDGTALVWTLRHIETFGTRRTFSSLLHGTMASAMPSAIGLQKCQPGRQVVCMAGDGGFAMLLGDLLTVVQEKVPIKIVVFNNGKLGFIDIEQKSAGLIPMYTDLKNPDFGEVAKADQASSKRFRWTPSRGNICSTDAVQRLPSGT